jgi:hypothetical protein
MLDMLYIAMMARDVNILVDPMALYLRSGRNNLIQSRVPCTYANIYASEEIRA